MLSPRKSDMVLQIHPVLKQAPDSWCNSPQLNLWLKQRDQTSASPERRRLLKSLSVGPIRKHFTS